MTSTTTGQNTSDIKTSKLPFPMSNTNASAVQQDTSTSQAKKPTLETRKSTEELRLRLASAVSAKIALGKDGKNLSTTTANRGIGFLLQRKDQQENRLNTKNISFQKSPRNGSEKPVDMTAKNTNSLGKGARGGMNKVELQKSLLSALMNSRTPGGSLGQNKSKDTRVQTASKLNTETKGKTIAKAPLPTPKTKNENLAKSLKSGGNGVANGTANPATGSKINKLGPKTDISGFNKTPRPISNPKSESVRSKPSLVSSNSSGGILNRAKNIERLLGQRKRANIPAESTITAKDVALNGKDKSTEQNKDITSQNKTTNGKNATENGTNNTTPENVGKKLPPPVAKKPSKADLQKSKQAPSPLSTNKQESKPLANGNLSSSREVSRQNGQRDIKSSLEIERKAGASKAGLGSKNETALLLNGLNCRKETGFREDLLEKLEADVGRCKIAAFQSVEDFSALRMKVYRMRGELDQLKRDREKRTSMVC